MKLIVLKLTERDEIKLCNISKFGPKDPPRNIQVWSPNLVTPENARHYDNNVNLKTYFRQIFWFYLQFLVENLLILLFLLLDSEHIFCCCGALYYQWSSYYLLHKKMFFISCLSFWMEYLWTSYPQLWENLWYRQY